MASPPAVVLAWVLLFLAAMTGLAAVLVEAPKLTLIAGLTALGFFLARGPAHHHAPATPHRAGRPLA